MSRSKKKAAQAEGTTQGPPRPATLPAPPAGPGYVSDEQVRLRAYQMWKAAGMPPSDGGEFWARAERELRGR